MVLFEVNKFKNTPKIKKKHLKWIDKTQLYRRHSDITFIINTITPVSSVSTFVHNYRIKGYKVNTV